MMSLHRPSSVGVVSAPSTLAVVMSRYLRAISLPPPA